MALSAQDPPATTPGAALRLRTLGEPSLSLVDATGATLDHQEVSKALALVTYLAGTPAHSASREHLIDLLWSDLDVDAGKHALRQHLWLLRRRFTDVVLAEKKSPVRLGPGITIDREELLAAANAGQCERVVQLYTGDFFPGFAAPGSGEFERWTELERARLRSLFTRSAEQLTRQWLLAGRVRDAQALARRVRDTDPLAQHGWRLLIEASLAASDELGARVIADEFLQQLAAEEVEPEPASRTLILAALRSATLDGKPRTAVFSPLVGRETEFSALLNAWQAATEGRANCVQLFGRAGYGKSRLLHDFRTRLMSLSARARVVAVRADAGAVGIPLALVSDLVAALGDLPGASAVSPESAATLVRLAPSLSSTYPAAQTDTRAGVVAEPHILRAAIRDLVTAIADERPLAILIDDLHFSDRDSAVLLAGALSALGKHRVLVVVAQRPSGVDSPFQHETATLSLTPLSETAISALLANVASLPAAAWSDRLAAALRRATGGSALLVVESLQLAIERGLLQVTDGEWRCSDPRALSRLLDAGGAVRLRIERLDGRERDLIRVLSIARVALPFDVVRTACASTGDEIRDPLAMLEQHGLVTQSNGDWQIGHDEFATAVLDGLPPSDASALHAALGDALLQQTETGHRLRLLAPHHLRQGGDWDGLSVGFRTLLRRARATADRRTVCVLAAEYLGVAQPNDDTERLVRSLPIATRVRQGATPRRVATAALSIGAPLAMLSMMMTERDAKPVTFDYVAMIGVGNSAGGMTLFDLPLTERSLNSDSAIVLDVESTKGIRLRPTYGLSATASPVNPSEWLTVQAMADSGITDIFLLNTDDASNQRLTQAASDDVDPTWSPDGTLVLFSTDRWSDLGRTSLALLDPRTRSVRRLTTSEQSDWGARWSPDGSRVAFSRRQVDGTQQLCLVTVDAMETRCVRSFPAGVGTIGWLSDSAVMIAFHEEQNVVLSRVDLAASGVTTRLGDLTAMPSLSPDGKWLLCDCRSDAETQPALMLIRANDLSVRRRISIHGSARELRNLLWRAAPSSRHIHRVQLSKGMGDPVVGVPYQLTATAFNAGGAARHLPLATFAVSDTTIASVSTTGLLLGHRPGQVTARLSAGGWRTDSVLLTVRANQRDTLFSETWSRGISATWMRFGEPGPIIIDEGAGRLAFSTNGDGRFHSGAVTEASYATSTGLSLTTDISTPITFHQWQELEIMMTFALDSARVSAWDSRAIYLWADGRTSDPYSSCVFKYPFGPEGSTYGADFGVTSYGGYVQLPAQAAVRSGLRTSLTLQVFPDGRCGLALNGIAVAVVGRPMSARGSSRVRVALMGNSYRTRVLVGPVLLRRGVDTTIDWRLAGSRRLPAVAANAGGAAQSRWAAPR